MSASSALETNVRKFVRTGREKSSAEVISMWEGMIRNGTMPPDINVQDNVWGNCTALIYQTDYGTKEAMEWLLTRQPPADVNIRDNKGYTTLMYLVDSKLKSCFRILKQAGADVNIESTDGKTALSISSIPTENCFVVSSVKLNLVPRLKSIPVACSL